MATRYINSGNIHVFPCAYRTQKTDDTASPNNWDPEARLNTEKNFANLATGLGKKSYLISWDGLGTTELCCVIGGYYFEILGETIETLKNKYLCIKIISNTIIEGSDTKILGTFDNDRTKYYLDRPSTDGEAIVYKFTGLVVSDEVVGTDYLQVVENNSIKYDEFLPNTITRGQNENTVVIGKYSAFANTDDVVIVANGTGAGTNRSNIAKITKTGIVDNGTIEVAGTATFNGAVNIDGNISAAGTASFANDLAMTSSAAKVTVAGSIIANGSTTFNNIVSAKAGLEVTGDSFYVGDSGVKITTAGDITANGSYITFTNLPQESSASAQLVQIDASGNLSKCDLTVVDPTASGTSLSFIDTISQNSDGKIIPTKKNITIENGTSQGQIKINGSDYTIKDLGSANSPIFKTIAITPTENIALEVATDGIWEYGLTNIYGDLTQNNLDEETTSQVTFNSNVDAKNGLDVVGNFTVEPASGSSPEVLARFKGNVAVTAGNLYFGNPSNVVYAAITSDGNAEFKGNVDAKNGLDVTGTLTVADKKTNPTLYDIFNIIYPIGYIYISTENKNPNTLFGFGTWTQIKDCFLLAAGDTYAAGDTGGEASVTLLTNQLPSHTHTDNGVSTTDFKSGKIDIRSYDNFAPHADYTQVSGPFSRGDITSNTKVIECTAMMNQTGLTGGIIWKGEHKHSIGNTGGGKSHNNMPPYLVVYMWKRVS